MIEGAGLAVDAFSVVVDVEQRKVERKYQKGSLRNSAPKG